MAEQQAALDLFSHPDRWWAAATDPIVSDWENSPGHVIGMTAGTVGTFAIPGGAALKGLRGAKALEEVAATARTGNVVDGLRLGAQLTGEEIAGGHAFVKHVVENGEFPGVQTRVQFASIIEDTVLNGEKRTLSGGRTAFWDNGTVVIRTPKAMDGGTAFRPVDGYDYFLGLD